MGEHSELERKETLDLDVKEHQVKLVREIVAMMNSGGGAVEIGVTNDGTDVGVDAALASRFDPARVGDLIETFIAPDRTEISVSRRALENGRHVICLNVPPAEQPPIVLCKTGNYQGDDGKQSQCFGAHTVLVRRNTKAEPARWEDFRRWREEAVARARDQLMARLTMVVEAPTDSRIRIVGADEVRDEPSFFLSRSAEVFRQRPAQLLTASDLQYLWLHRTSLELDASSSELIFHSVLRRRATLWLWLAVLRLSAAEVERLLDKSLELRDRDKSDAARSMLQVAAVFLDETGYERVRTALGSSEYAHMRRAAADLPTVSRAIASLDRGVRGADVESANLTLEELVDEARHVLAAPDSMVSRRLPPIAWDYFTRTRRT